MAVRSLWSRPQDPRAGEGHRRNHEPFEKGSGRGADIRMRAGKNKARQRHNGNKPHDLFNEFINHAAHHDADKKNRHGKIGRKRVWALSDQPAGKCVSAASEVPPALAKAPNQRKEIVIRIQSRKAKTRFSRINP